MALFPKIQSPCPYKGNLSAVMDGDFCRACKRDVVDLTAWSDEARVNFLASCETEVCVSYRLPVKSALVAAAMAAAVSALPAAAQEVAAAQDVSVTQDADPALAYEEEQYIIVGGITDPKNTEFVEDAADAAIPEMPVIYEAPAGDATRPGAPVSDS
jgi:predicted Fe-S protein YdhL (DUF1289 family)